MVVQGATAGSFSPLSPFGAITGQLLAAEGLPQQQPGLFLNSFVFNVVVGALVFWLFGGLRLARERRRAAAADTDVDVDVDPAVVSGGPGGSGGGLATAEAPAAAPAEVRSEVVSAGRLSAHQVFTLAGLGLLVVVSTAFGLDVGFSALAIGLALTLLKPGAYSEVVSKVPWSAVLLVCGVITYVGVLDSVGTIDFLSDLLTGGTSPLVAALAASYIGGLISAFASTAGVLGASIPLAAPLLDGGMLPILGTVSAIGIASSVVDVSPLSTNGALLVANQRSMDSRLFFRKLLLWSIPVIALVPLIAWLVFVVLWPF
ncbi:SLC13 family permease [Saccharomonospora sp. CUA-673]|uniref:SLC13 family permease n=1 Tax=Saccharomonospora sp. CUA-673 TaxID=1904969 RepID=UPI0009FAF474